MGPVRRAVRGVATLDDVAAAAGVSRATASRALNGVTTVAADAVRAVEAAAAELGYRPNRAARSLARGRHDSLALVITEDDLADLPRSFFAQPLRGATAAAARRSVQLVLLLAGQDDDDPTLRRYLDGSHVDGAMVILEASATHLPRVLGATDVPVVYLGRPVDDAACSFVDVDNYGGGRLATAALAEAGRRVVGTVAGPASMSAAVDRLAGWRDELVRRGLRVPPAVHGDFTADGGAAAMARLLAVEPGLDGVFVASDLMATGALRVLAASGRRVPTDVSVVGYDDSLLAATATPPLTSVSQPLEEMGALMVDLLLERVADPAARPVRRVLPARLTRRQSV